MKWTWIGLCLLALVAHPASVRAQDVSEDAEASADGVAQPSPVTGPQAPTGTAATPNAVVDDTDDDDADDTVSEADDATTERARWERRARKARERVEKAQARVAAARAAYQNMRQRQYPRGEAAHAIVKEVAEAKKALASAEERLRLFGDAAAAADVPPAWIEPY